MEKSSEYSRIRGMMRDMEQGRSRAARLLRRAVNEALTERQAEMVRLRYSEQLTMRDIAERLGVNPSTVSRTLKTAREKLKICLKYSAQAFTEED